METEPLAEGTLRSYLRILAARKWSVVIVVLVTLAGTYFYTHRQPTIYQASAGLLLAPTPTQQIIQGASLTYSMPSVPDQIAVLEGNGVAALVKQKLGYAPGISGSEVGQTDEMLVSAQASTPVMAAKIANAYTQAYMAYVADSTVDNLNASNKILQGELSSVQDQLASLNSQLASAQRSGNTTQASSIQSQINSVQAQQNLLNQEVTQIAQAVQFAASGAQIVSTATPPSSPIQPNLKKNLLFGLIAGLVLGIGFVVAREYFDDTIRSEEELHFALARSERTSRVLVLGAIPFGEEYLPGTSGTLGVVSITDPTSPQAEAYRELRTSLQFLQVREPIEVVLVTSPSGGEGKSTTLSNLAVMLAKTGKSVVMCSCDLRRPRLHEYFGTDNDVGFTSVLVGDAGLDEAIHPIEGVEGLSMLPAGPLPPNPAELLASPGAEQIIQSLKSRFDVVLIDSPPVLRVTDAAVISTLADTTLLVVRAGLTTRRDMVKSLDTFDRIGSPVAGIVVNALPTELTYKDRYYYAPYPSSNGSPYPTLEGVGPNGSVHLNGAGRRKERVPVGSPAVGATSRAESPSRPSSADIEAGTETDTATKGRDVRAGARGAGARLTFADDDPGTAAEELPSPGRQPPRNGRPRSGASKLGSSGNGGPGVTQGGSRSRGSAPPARGRLATWLLGPPKRKRPPSR